MQFILASWPESTENFEAVDGRREIWYGTLFVNCSYNIFLFDSFYRIKTIYKFQIYLL